MVDILLILGSYIDCIVFDAPYLKPHNASYSISPYLSCLYFQCRLERPIQYSEGGHYGPWFTFCVECFSGSFRYRPSRGARPFCQSVASYSYESYCLPCSLPPLPPVVLPLPHTFHSPATQPINVQHHPSSHLCSHPLSAPLNQLRNSWTLSCQVGLV